MVKQNDYYKLLEVFIKTLCPHIKRKNYHYCDGSVIPRYDVKGKKDTRADAKPIEVCKHYVSGKCLHPRHPKNIGKEVE